MKTCKAFRIKRLIIFMSLERQIGINFLFRNGLQIDLPFCFINFFTVSKESIQSVIESE